MGCALGALGYVWLGMWSFALPPVLALVSMAYVDGPKA